MNYLDQYAKPFSFEDKADAVCLLIHGFTGSPSHMRYLGEFLHQEANYDVEGILLPGHGTTLEDMEETDWKDWLNKAKEEYKKLDQEYDKVYVMGLSMGGILSLILAEEYNVDGVVSIASPIKIYDRLAYLTPILKYFKRYDLWEEDQEKDKYDVGYSASPLKTVPSLLKLMRRAKKNLKKIKAPALIIQSYQDQTVKPVSAEIIYKKIASEEKELLWLENSGHVCTIGEEKDLIHEKVYSFLKK